MQELIDGTPAFEALSQRPRVARFWRDIAGVSAKSLLALLVDENLERRSPRQVAEVVELIPLGVRPSETAVLVPPGGGKFVLLLALSLGAHGGVHVSLVLRSLLDVVVVVVVQVVALLRSRRIVDKDAELLGRVSDDTVVNMLGGGAAAPPGRQASADGRHHRLPGGSSAGHRPADRARRDRAPVLVEGRRGRGAAENSTGGDGRRLGGWFRGLRLCLDLVLVEPVSAHAALELAVSLLENIHRERSLVEGLLEDLFGEREVGRLLGDPSPVWLVMGGVWCSGREGMKSVSVRRRKNAVLS